MKIFRISVWSLALALFFAAGGNAEKRPTVSGDSASIKYFVSRENAGIIEKFFQSKDYHADGYQEYANRRIFVWSDDNAFVLWYRFKKSKYDAQPLTEADRKAGADTVASIEGRFNGLLQSNTELSNPLVVVLFPQLNLVSGKTEEYLVMKFKMPESLRYPYQVLNTFQFIAADNIWRTIESQRFDKGGKVTGMLSVKKNGEIINQGNSTVFVPAFYSNQQPLNSHVGVEDIHNLQTPKEGFPK